LKDFLHNIYNGFLRFSPLRKNLRFATQKGTFPKLGFLDSEKKHEFEKALGIRINQVEYFEQALTHRSYLQVVPEMYLLSNERLEFLGDALLNLTVADYLFSLHSNVDEGNLTKMRAQLVNKDSLALFAKKYNLESFIQMSFSARKSIKNGSESIGADATEAVIGAIYLDSGFDAARKFIINSLVPAVMTSDEFTDKNFKSRLLELVQSLGKSSPKYTVLEESGPDHAKVFNVGVFVGETMLGTGKGKSKKQAEQIAAKDALFNNLETIKNL